MKARARLGLLTHPQGGSRSRGEASQPALALLHAGAISVVPRGSMADRRKDGDDAVSLNHQFYLVRKAEHDYSDYAAFVSAPGGVELHDDLIDYMWDTLSWIPTILAARGERFQGLDRWGPTVIDHQGALVARTVFGAWADLFACGPETLTLRGPWVSTSEGGASGGEYETLRADRDELVTSLRSLASYAGEVIGARGELYILHLGI